MLTLGAIIDLVGSLMQLIGYGFIYNLNKSDLVQMEEDLGKNREEMKVGLADVVGSDD